MKLLRFLDFILEASSDVLLPFRVSSEIYQKLVEIDSPISSKLLGVIKSRQLSKYTLLTISDDGNIEYSDSYRVDEFMKKETSNPEYPTSHWLNSSMPEPSNDIYKYRRISIGIGRFINKFFPFEFTSSEIENFVNQWRSLVDKQPNFELWSGYEIRNGYRSNNYHFTDTNMNTLMNSCMNDEFEFIEMYEYCSDLRLLVLLDDENHILGRALVWKDYKGRYIMDRVYYVYDSDYHKFVKYAVQNGWFYKKRNISGGSSFVKGDTEMSLDTKVAVPNVFDAESRGDKFPYMDTFYFAQGNWAYNKPPEDGRYLKLTDTDGGFEVFSGLYDVHGQEIINEDDYVYSKEQQGYIFMDDAIHINYSGGAGYEHYSYDDWVEKRYLNREKHSFIKVDDKWYRERDCVWSDSEQKWIWRANAIPVKGDWVSWDNFNPERK